MYSKGQLKIWLANENNFLCCASRNYSLKAFLVDTGGVSGVKRNANRPHIEGTCSYNVCLLAGSPILETAE